jgi:hypothetical protein
LRWKSTTPDVSIPQFCTEWLLLRICLVLYICPVLRDSIVSTIFASQETVVIAFLADDFVLNVFAYLMNWCASTALAAGYTLVSTFTNKTRFLHLVLVIEKFIANFQVHRKRLRQRHCLCYMRTPEHSGNIVVRKHCCAKLAIICSNCDYLEVNSA